MDAYLQPGSVLGSPCAFQFNSVFKPMFLDTNFSSLSHYSDGHYKWGDFMQVTDLCGPHFLFWRSLFKIGVHSELRWSERGLRIEL